MNSATKARLRGLRLRRKPQMDCANTAQRSAGTKYTAAARRRNVAGSLMATTSVLPQVRCQRPLGQPPPPRAGEQIAATSQHLLRRPSHQSVVKHFDAYADIDWDAADYRIAPEDPRWELGSDDALGATVWYRAQPQATRARLGLHLVATKMKIGTQFENVLQRGLLEFAWTLPNGAPEFRYVYHEVIEEGQHSLMFQEFVNRTGFDVAV